MQTAQHPLTRPGRPPPPSRPLLPRAPLQNIVNSIAEAVAVAACAPRCRRHRPVTIVALAASDPSTPNQTTCPLCSGSGRVPCTDCNGAGILGRGGYVRKNPLPKNLVGSKWTAAGKEPVLGWRHFVVEEARKGGVDGSSSSSASSSSSSSPLFVRLRASCDPGAKLWVSAQLLRDRQRWAAGWLRMDDVVLRVEDGGEEEAPAHDKEDGEEEDEKQQQQQQQQPKGRRDRSTNSNKTKKIVVRGSVGTGAPCRKCSGTGWRPCSGCRGEGRADLIVL